MIVCVLILSPTSRRGRSFQTPLELSVLRGLSSQHPRRISARPCCQAFGSPLRSLPVHVDHGARLVGVPFLVA
jgi:hypothetical protein